MSQRQKAVMPKLPLRSDVISPGDDFISTVEMHTTGEPTRIIYAGFPPLSGSTLLEKRADAMLHYDHLRKRLMHEPRGHREMFGALIVADTDLVLRDEADIGVLFLQNEGWSTMCGHATIAMGRFLVDFDPAACPNLLHGRRLPQSTNDGGATTSVRLHCPCGVVTITIPVKMRDSGAVVSDPERSISFVNVDSYTTGIGVQVSIPESLRWPELDKRVSVVADFCYGGAFYCVVDVCELGFHDGLRKAHLDDLSRATRALKSALCAGPDYKKLFHHEVEANLGFLYGIIVTDERQAVVAEETTAGGELGVCFFAGQQIDRSPCGSGVSARRALAHSKYSWLPGKRWTYHSLVSHAHGGCGGFVAQVVGATEKGKVRVQIEGQAYYTGYATFLVEEADGIANSGFTL